MSEELTITVRTRTAGASHQRKDTSELFLPFVDIQKATKAIEKVLDTFLSASIDTSYISTNVIVIEVSPGFESPAAIADEIEEALEQSVLRL